MLYLFRGCHGVSWPCPADGAGDVVCFTVYQAIDAYWAPHIGMGNLAYLGYAQRILVGVGTLMVAGPSAVLLPRLAEAYVQGRNIDLLQDTARGSRAVIAFATPAAIFISLLAEPLVGLLFERGAFDHRATSGVTEVLPLMMLGMVLMLCVVILFRALFSRQEVLLAAQLGILATVLYFFLSGALSRNMGVKGIAIAYALSWGVVLVLGGVGIWQGKSSICTNENILFIRRILIINAVLAIIILLGRQWISSMPYPFFKLSLIFVVSFIVYFVLAVRKIAEVYIVYSYLCSKLSLRKS